MQEFLQQFWQPKKVGLLFYQYLRTKSSKQPQIWYTTCKKSYGYFRESLGNIEL